jgi:hypothetical protein
VCADCLIGKSQQRPHWRHGSNKGATAFLQRLHLDCTARHPTKLFGTASPSGMRHMLSPSGMRHMGHRGRLVRLQMDLLRQVCDGPH